MNSLEAISNRRVKLFAEYSQDSGLFFEEWLIEKLIAEEQENEILERLKLRVAEYYALFELDERKRKSRQAVMKQHILAIVLESLR